MTRTYHLTILFCLVTSGGVHAAVPIGHVWIEGEKPSSASFSWKAAGAARSELLSENRWLMAEERLVLPDDGVRATYNVNVPKTATYTVWLRIGFEWIRPRVAWKIDEGPWTTVGSARTPERNEKPPKDAPPSDLERRTTNVVELAEWNEVAWWNVGEARCEAGPHRLHVRFLKSSVKNPLIALDVVSLVAGPWTPDGALKPGERYDHERDRRAARQVFRLEKPAAAATRTDLTLTGLWQIARYDDPDMNLRAREPLERLPSKKEYDLAWRGVPVPSSVWNDFGMGFAHRVIYRTKVHVPAEHAGRGFTLHFSGTNWLASVFVNGALAGTHRGVWIPWDLDITPHVKPGTVNEIAVAIKGPYYAIDAEHLNNSDLNSYRNRPFTRLDWVFWIAPIYPSTKGDGDGRHYGLVNPVTLSSVGRCYTEDVFIKPSVARKALTADITVRNTLDRNQTVRVRCEAISDRTNRVEKTFEPQDLAVPAGGMATVTIGGPWRNPALWWPEPDPHLYRLRTVVSQGTETVDVNEELFGFREVTVDGPAIRINGVRRNVWCWVDVRGQAWNGADWLKAFRAEKNRFIRFSHNRTTRNFLPTREERLEFYDRNGIPGRLCSMIDGMYIASYLGDRRREGNKNVFVPNEPVWEGWREHIAQLTRAYRNHPSVIMYQIENELVYITGMNIYGGYLPDVERKMLEVYRAGKANDPTRPYTVGGAGDLSKAAGIAGPEEALEINCPHYAYGEVDYYPENAYTIQKYATKISRWPWTRTKPWVVGESLYSAHLELGSYTIGQEAFRSQDAARRGKAKFLRMIYGGWRWAGVAGFFPWDNLSAYEDTQKIFSDICVIPRKQTQRLYGGRQNRIHVKIMNDTFSPDPITFQWWYTTRGSVMAAGKETITAEPGFGIEKTITLKPPATQRRLEGTFSVKALHPKAAPFIDERTVPIVPVVTSITARGPITVLDRSGSAAAFLKRTGTAFETIDSLRAAAGKKGLLLIGADTLTVEEAFGTELLAFAARGGAVIVLEQEHPVSGGNLPAPVKTTPRYGGYAHPQALGTPLFRDLGKEDLIDWAGDHPVYKNVYVKPARGGRSLVECGALLPYSALLEVSAGDGIIVLCQLRVGAKLGSEPAADILLRNLIECYGGYKPSRAVAAVHAPDNDLLRHAIEETGVLQARAPNLRAALDPTRFRAAVIDATTSNLTALNELRAEAGAFFQGGGWIMLCGVRPEGIDAFNAFAGTEHLLRPFRIERVNLMDTDTPLAATLGDGDVMLYGTEWIARWMGRRWVSGNTFSYVIDSFDAAPFTYPPGAPKNPYAYKPTRDDKDPYNFVNGLLLSDFWKYIQQIWIEETPEPLTFHVRRPERIKEIRIWNNTAYSTIEKLDILFDGDKADPASVVLPDSGDVTAVTFPEPRRVEKTITLKIRTWRTKQHANPNAAHLVGIDNVQFIRAKRPSGGVFLDTAGGLVAFPRGKGGIFLNQIKFMKDEPLVTNAAKKVRLTSTILQNMGVGTRAAAVAVPGVNIAYQTIDITDRCTHYMAARQGTSRAWFGARGQDLTKLPLGKHHFADVLYHVVDYGTAPVPDCIVLGGLRRSPPGLRKEVRGIPIGTKADVFFFLHAAYVTRPLNERERQRLNDRRRPFERPEVARYILNYADGTTAVIPVILEVHVDHWLQENPRPLPGAHLAWSAVIEAAGGRRAAIYSMKAANPRPGVAVRSIDILPGMTKEGKPANRAVPALLAITAGTVRSD